VLFSSLEFLLLFLPLALSVALRLHGQPLLRWIALISVLFYAFAGHWWFIVPMLITTVVDYWVAILIERERLSTRATCSTAARAAAPPS
jgi:ABC-type transport system involved in Fe-S cluster assembly fused permease/ATPase subunit